MQDIIYLMKIKYIETNQSTLKKLSHILDNTIDYVHSDAPIGSFIQRN